MPDKYNYPQGPQAINDTHHQEPHWLAISLSKFVLSRSWR